MYFWNKDLHHWRKSKTLFCNWIVFESQNLSLMTFPTRANTRATYTPRPRLLRNRCHLFVSLHENNKRESARKMEWKLSSFKSPFYAMFSLQVSLSRFLHCLLHVLCFTVLILGEVDKAFIDVIIQSEEGQNSSFANMVGKFARIGAMKQVEGELKEVRTLWNVKVIIRDLFIPVQTIVKDRDDIDCILKLLLDA